MKAHITLRSTLSNTSWMVRGAAALLLAMFIFTLTLALLANPPAPVATPAIGQAAPAARSPNVPISSFGSAYDGGQYGDLASVARHSPSLPVLGTGSAYDGGAYRVGRPAV